MKKLLMMVLILGMCVGYTTEEKRVYVDVVGDLFHAGHIEFFKKARSEGTYLIVGIHNDQDVEAYKRLPILTQDERATIIESCIYVDEVLLDAPIGVTKELIEDNKIDLVIHGDDFQNEEIILEHYGVPVSMGIFKTVPYTAGISTTDIIERIKSRNY